MTTQSFDLAVALPSASAGEPGHVQRAARLAETLDFHSAWVGDHLWFQQQPMVEAVVALSVAAGATDRLKLGFGVLQGGLRHPVLLAKMLGSLTMESRDRLLIGFGVGGTISAEWRAVGASTRQRGRLLDELLDVLPPLLRGEPVRYVGKTIDIDAPGLIPAPTTLPPIWVGGTSEKALRRAAAHDGWLGFLCAPMPFATKVNQLSELCAERDRPMPTVGFALIASICGSEQDAKRRCADYLSSSYGIPLELAERWAVGGISELTNLINGYVEGGADLVQVYTVDEPEQAWPLLREHFV